MKRNKNVLPVIFPPLVALILFRSKYCLPSKKQVFTNLNLLPNVLVILFLYSATIKVISTLAGVGRTSSCDVWVQGGGTH